MYKCWLLNTQKFTWLRLSELYVRKCCHKLETGVYFAQNTIKLEN